MLSGNADIAAWVAGLVEEDELAGPAAVASNVAAHYDRVAGLLMRCGDVRALTALVGLVSDERPVCRMAAPSLPLNGGYGKTFGLVTVGEKARFILARMLPPQVLREALKKGPTWVEARSSRLHWDELTQCFRLAGVL